MFFEFSYVPSSDHANNASALLFHNQLQSASAVCATDHLIATMMPLVSLNIKTSRQDFHCFLGRDVVTCQFFFVEFKFELLRVELVPVNQT